MPGATIVLVEGGHDTVFFRKTLALRSHVNIKTIRFAAVADQVRNPFAGTTFVDCQGAANLHFAISRLMTDLIWNISELSAPKLVAIGDGDKFSMEGARRKLEEFVNKPGRYYEFKFEVNLRGASVLLKEARSDEVLAIECHIVPQSLEHQVYAALSPKVKTKISGDLPIDDRLRAAATYLSVNLDSLIEMGAVSLADETWASTATAAILV